MERFRPELLSAYIATADAGGGGGEGLGARSRVSSARRGGEDDGGGGAVETGESWKLERQYAELGGVFPKNSGSLLGLIWACT